MAKNLPANAEATGSIPGYGRAPLEEEMAIHFSILTRKIQWTEDPDGLQWGRKELDMIE